MKIKHLIPLAIFLVIAIFLGVGLTRDPRKLPSTFIDKPAPQFRVPQVVSAEKTFSPQDMKGQVWMLNVYASWCVACRVEHPLLVEIAKSNAVPLIGLNYKDKREDALKMLEQQGNPYTLSAYDLDGRVGIDFGVYGVPETFIIDKNGVIRHKQIGPITPEALKDEILPLIAKLKAAA
ncbi:DsbE family thiol:disulfide interchange protein [Ramlibacter alkalitolerans]|uniref:DsbE family thiol:disulfide interchange protein n=1 Tax=Ramlibacter alkalitolerans TaxID=2039631 RepID=A0ABS1JK44_9BURK|nr:DsbE family thiol:disulfide interchange protein [Ramlibacter alkalitolerans]